MGQDALSRARGSPEVHEETLATRKCGADDLEETRSNMLYLYCEKKDHDCSCEGLHREKAKSRCTYSSTTDGQFRTSATCAAS